ncbi:ferrochelatase [Nocardioides aurantiacus]|uniref:Coproporphyrin III ferrochelatase n=1 Tax=Nocardioides aurantiacus TaxID=86796 RepID=A0A3N2CVW9_9ACTN|nr:ferrochelatase [Nocardioides aurantiacus]ROR91354.1 ferrochelatase [Nocardioides aurantiacus]
MASPTPYDALLLVSFGGPEKPADVVPFLRNVTAGKNIPDARLEEVGEHYYGFGGRSPINDQNRAFVEALRADLAADGVDVPVYWGNRNWDPYLADTLAQMRDDGVQRAAALVTSAYSSYSGCRQYRENLAAAVAEVPGAPRIDKLRHYYNHPGFLEPMVDATLAALAELPEAARRAGHLAFVTHSIPVSMDDSSGPDGNAYTAQHRLVMEQVVARVRQETGHRYPAELVFCSRSGPPHVPWLEPDVNDHLRDLHAREVPGAVVVPIGFVSDHMEVIYDLDTEARATAEEIGLPFARAATAGVDPRFVAMARDLLLERAAVEADQPTDQPVERAAVGSPASWDVCPVGCCPNPRGARPALSGQD